MTIAFQNFRISLGSNNSSLSLLFYCVVTPHLSHSFSFIAQLFLLSFLIFFWKLFSSLRASLAFLSLPIFYLATPIVLNSEYINLNIILNVLYIKEDVHVSSKNLIHNRFLLFSVILELFYSPL